MVTYGWELRWTTVDGVVTTVRIAGYPTAEEALAEIWDVAREHHWTPPRWWEWWRRHDNRLPPLA